MSKLNGKVLLWRRKIRVALNIGAGASSKILKLAE